MKTKPLFLGKTPLKSEQKEVSGEYTTLNAEDFFVIRNYAEMRPFFMSLVSATDHWLFISSTGGLTAGRKNPDNALFPYYSDDKIAESAAITGSKTIIKVETTDAIKVWEPFNKDHVGVYGITSNIYKNREGSQLIFEEINEDLGLTFQYGWGFSEKYGIVKTANLKNDSAGNVSIELLDGVQNILPHGVGQPLQNSKSTLVDAYKRSILDEKSKVGVFALSSMIIDKAEPSEALKATSVWSVGLEAKTLLLSSLQLNAFKYGKSIESELDVKAEKGAFLVHSEFNLKANESKDWMLVCEVGQSAVAVEKLKQELSNTEYLKEAVKADILKNKEDLRQKIGLSDGIQLSNDRLSSGRHFSNVLFNIMRGGTFEDVYEIDTEDLQQQIKVMNKVAHKEMRAVLDALPKKIAHHELRHFLVATKQQKMLRYYLEYLPLSFSRRHGDPSRPWNYFSIEIKDENGNKTKNFEGNWRDIFQNWEALAYSFPEYTLGMISKFVNASTIDGYNPYRISKEGIDWEVIEPNDPWSYIGYWGDHQVIYLCRLLEVSQSYHPERLAELLESKIFTYANVPYKIRGYDAIVRNPSDTIDFDHALESEIQKRVEKIGSDGKLIWNEKEDLLKVNLTEKLLVMALTKLYNFIPEAGIWLNTQRPEWNDANNALVGNGVSMVTLYYLRRFLDFARKIYTSQSAKEFEVNKPVYDLLMALKNGFKQYESKLDSSLNDTERRDFMDAFGVAGEHYRTSAYAGFNGFKKRITTSEIVDFFELSQRFLEHSIRANKREDKMYHAYNLIELPEGKAKISHLYEMLEGQVAVLSANYLSVSESADVLNGLKSSKMYREDQYSYILYPFKELDSFLEKNYIPETALSNSKLLPLLMNNNDRSIVEEDVNRRLHFNANFNNETDLSLALDQLKTSDYGTLVRSERKLFTQVFEQIFQHKYFTGRSGSFYGYEGLGSIYWHMVSKLLVAIQENLRNTADVDTETRGTLIEHYYEIRASIGVDKSPDLYGAFPTDPYSHTPKYAGAKQPGMTGQVKEDVINRWAELGIKVEGGQLKFAPFILRKQEFLDTAGQLSYYNSDKELQKIEVPENGLGFTYCQIPIIYKIGKKQSLTINYKSRAAHTSQKMQLGLTDSKSVFKRKGEIEFIEVTLKEESLLN